MKELSQTLKGLKGRTWRLPVHSLPNRGIRVRFQIFWSTERTDALVRNIFRWEMAQ